MRWAGHVACMVAISYAYNIQVGKPKGKRTLDQGNVRYRWDNIKIHVEKCEYIFMSKVPIIITMFLYE
jgi:hypothetical protein